MGAGIGIAGAKVDAKPVASAAGVVAASIELCLIGGGAAVQDDMSLTTSPP